VIVVTGSMRSGTSMWMQVLEAAGLPIIGAAFPAQWESTIGEHNVGGFYESILRRGIHAATNPNPRTGRFIPPELTRRHVVKIFATGLARTEPRFVDDFVLTVRGWRAFARSRERLLSDEHAAFEARFGITLPERAHIPPLLEWITDQAVAIGAIRRHGYRGRIVAYERALVDPELVREVVLGLGTDADAALRRLDSAQHRVRDAEARDEDRLGMDPELAREAQDVADALHAALMERRPIARPILEQLEGLLTRCRGPLAAAESERAAAQKRWRRARRAKPDDA
jgi:hypothetical protein